MIRSLGFILRTLLFGWFLALIEFFVLLCRRCRNREREKEKPRCLPLERPEVIQPDPLIYPQYFLSSLGFAVTWNSPDIALRRDGKFVSSAALKKSTTYEVVAQIWNGSAEAPAIAMTVHFSYLEFGIGTVSHPIGSKDNVSVGVKGGMSCPAYTSIPWTTPSTEGHYCLQVLLAPKDDANYLNNLSQENTNVGTAHSPALFAFALRNNTAEPHTYRFEADVYQIGVPEACSIAAREEAKRKLLERHGRGSAPLPAGWTVKFDPDSPSLAPNEQVAVNVQITPPPGFAGNQGVNVNAYYKETLAGGVTLVVKA